MKLKYLLISLAVFIFVGLLGITVSADEVTGNLGGGTESGFTGTVANCNPLTVAHGTVSAYPSCTLTCDSGYTKSGNTCVVANSGGGGGGGGVTYCTSVTYADWQTACIGSLQFRNVTAQSPYSCTLTSVQQLATQRSCPAPTPTSTPPVATSTPPTGTGTGTGTGTSTGTGTGTGSSGSGIFSIAQILNEAQIAFSADLPTILDPINGTQNETSEENSLTKYVNKLTKGLTLTATETDAIMYFIVYGTESTRRLGAGERAGVLGSYREAYDKLPKTEAEWSDVIKIANGRWPSERNAAIEAQAKIHFKKVYRRSAVMTNNIDENAIMIIAYGLRPVNRNTLSEAAAIRTFRAVYGYQPTSSFAWNIVRAIAYSGAKR